MKRFYILGILNLVTREYITQALEPFDIIPTENIANADFILEPKINIKHDDSVPDLIRFEKPSVCTLSTHTDDFNHPKYALRTYNNAIKTHNKIYHQAYKNRTKHK